jgi:hypothetical protein
MHITLAKSPPPPPAPNILIKSVLPSESRIGPMRISTHEQVVDTWQVAEMWFRSGVWKRLL